MLNISQFDSTQNYCKMKTTEEKDGGKECFLDQAEKQVVAYKVLESKVNNQTDTDNCER